MFLSLCLYIKFGSVSARETFKFFFFKCGKIVKMWKNSKSIKKKKKKNLTCGRQNAYSFYCMNWTEELCTLYSNHY